MNQIACGDPNELQFMATKAKVDESEVWKRWAINIGGGLAAIALSLLLVMVVMGDRFASTLRIFGINIVEAGGVFLDCSKAVNKNKRFCNRDIAPPVEKEWKQVKGSQEKYVPFGLSD